MRAVITDTTDGLASADEQTACGFQIQPVYSIPTDLGFNFIARGIVPITGLHNDAVGRPG